MPTLLQIIFRLLLSAGLCGIIGLEREYRHKPAGLRTNILVGMGSTLVILMSLYATGQDNGDILRLASGVITGIGFLGAGVIIRGQGGQNDEDMVHGITTAATIWIVAVIGLAVGLGFYFGAITAAVIALAVLYGLNSERIRNKISK